MAGPVDADRVMEPGLGVCAALKGVPVVCSANLSAPLSSEKYAREGGFCELPTQKFCLDNCESKRSQFHLAKPCAEMAFWLIGWPGS